MGDKEEVDYRKLSKEVIDMLVLNGCDEPWLYSVVEGFIKLSKDRLGDINFVYGVSDGNDFIGLDFGLLNNIIEVEYPLMNYWLVSNVTGRVEKLVEIDMEESIREGRFSESIDVILHFLNVQVSLEEMTSDGGSPDAFDDLIKSLL